MPGTLGSATLGGGTLGDPGGIPFYEPVAVLNEFPPDRISVTLRDPSTGGAIARWAEDEANTENALSGIRKSGEMCGGHKEFSGTLARDPRASYPDLEPYTELIAAQAGGEPIWEGRLDKAPEADGQRMAIEPAAVGHSKALEDRQGILLGFIDQDLTRWTDPSTQRKVNLGEAHQVDAIMSTGWQESGENPPGINFSWKGLTSVEHKSDRGEAWYYGGGPDVGGILYHFANLIGTGNAEFWETRAYLSTNDIASETQGGVEHDGFTNSSEFEHLEATKAGFKYALIVSDRYEVGTGGANLPDLQSWQRVIVLGNQALPLQGSWPRVGFTAKQMLEYAIPAFSYLSADSEDLDDDEFVIPQAWFNEPTVLATVVKELTKYGLYRWFILDGKRFELRKPGTFGRNWQASVGPSELQEAGIDGSRLWRTIVVRWQDVDGSTRTAGPPGSGCTVESAGLEITDPDHPAVKAGITREDVLDLQGISEEKFAIQVGERWLTEANEVSHSGQATLRGFSLDDRGIFRPVAQVMPGDRIRFPDAGSGGTDYREIVQTDYDHDSRTCTVTLDAPKEAVQAILERYRARLSAAGIR